jgi:mycoredoxin-dependent peroxiredoxin
MPVAVGQQAPDFTLVDQDGERFTLSSLRGRRNVVLMFFPGAFSPGCTVQFTVLRGSLGRYAELDAEVVGVSVDGLFSLRAFRDSLGLSGVRLLADFEPKGEVARRYGVLQEMGFSERATFVIDRAGVVRDAVVTPDPGQPDEEATLAALASCRPAAEVL